MSAPFGSLRNKGIISALAGGGIGVIIYLMSPNPTVKTIGNWLCLGSVGSLIATQFVVDSAEKINDELSKQTENKIVELTKDLASERKKVVVKTKELEDSISLIKLLKEESQLLKTDVDAIRVSLKIAQSKIDSLNCVNSQTAIELLNESVAEFQTQIEDLFSKLSRRYPQINSWDGIAKEYSEKVAEFSKQINVVATSDSVEDLIGDSLALQHEIIYRGSLIKIKAYKSVVTFLTSQLIDVIPLESHKKIISNLKADYIKNVNSIRQEYGHLVDTASEEFSEHLKELCDRGVGDADTISSLQLENYKLNQKLAELSKPHLFPGLSEQSRVGNSIINYFLRLGITLDALEWQTTETGYILLFHTDRNGSRFISIDILNDENHPEKFKEVSGAINLPKFEQSQHACHVKLEIVRKPKTKVVSDDDIKLIVGSPEEFIKYITSHPIRYRLIADPGVGKSPTTAVMISEILKVGGTKGNTGKGAKIPNTLVTVSYPGAQSSQKDVDYPLEIFLKYGDTTAALKSFEDCLEDGNYRSHHTRYTDNFFHVWVWDEFDNTISSSDDPLGTGSKIRRILKQFGHLNIGWIVSGQSVMTKEIPGFTNDDRSLFTEIIIGVEKIRRYLKIYGKLNLSEKVVERLAKNLESLEEYLEVKNALVTDEARLLRVALVLDSRSPKLYFLPNLDCVEFDTDKIAEAQKLAEQSKRSILADKNDGALSVDVQKSYYTSTDQNNVRSSNSTIGGVGHFDQKPHCPHCGASELTRLSDGRYSCKGCLKRFVESKVIWK